MLTERIVAVSLVCAAASMSAAPARAESTIRDPRPPVYAVELEPKLNLNYFLFERYGGQAVGPGIRASIPLMSPGFVRTINDNAAITFGLDLMHYDGTGYYGWSGYCNGNPKNCPGWYVGYNTSFWAIQLPVALQWNFFVATRWSVFGEMGLTFRHAFLADTAWCSSPGYAGPCSPNANDFFFTFYGGGRFHFSEKVALTMRIGHPTAFSIGASIFF